MNRGVELRDLEAYGEPGAIVYRADCVELMRLMPEGCVGAIFADPPYRLSTGGVSVRSGRLIPVDKGEWDRSRGIGKSSSKGLVASYGTPCSQVQHTCRAPSLNTTRKDRSGTFVLLGRYTVSM
jgi:hypothetical protein